MELRQRVPVWTLFRYTLAVGALGWVLMIVEWERTLGLLGGMSSWLVLGILTVSAAGEVPRVWMWSSLLGHFEHTNFTDVLQADLVIKFVNTLFPSRFSGRSVAPVAFRHFTGVSWADATAVTGVHTGLYAVWYALACLAGLVFLAPRLSPGVLALVALSTGVYIVVAVLIVFGGSQIDRLEPLLERLASRLGRLPFVGERIGSLVDGIPGVIADSATGFWTVLRDRRVVLGYGISWVLALAILPSVRFYLLFAGLGVTPDAPLLLPLYLITAYAVTVLPLTPGGVGVAEATSTLVFVALGYPSAVVVPAVVLDRFLGVYIPALAGWYPASTVDFSDLVPDIE